MIERPLLDALDQVAARQRRLRLRRFVAISWGLLAIAAAGLFFAPQATRFVFALAVPIVCLAAIALFIAARVGSRRAENSRLVTAREIEARYPALDAKLLAALKQIEDARATGTPLGYLQSTVVRQAVEHADQYDWNETVPSPSLRRWGLAQTMATAALIAVLAAFIIQAEPFTSRPGGTAADINVVANPADPANTLTVEPGNVELERGSSLIVTARFAQRIPANTTLVVEGLTPSPSGRGQTENAAQPRFQSGEGAATSVEGARGHTSPPLLAKTTRSIPMSPSLDDPLAGARVANVQSDLTYRVVAEGLESPVFHVKVFEYPRLLQADATLTYPGYTAQSEKTIEDTRQVTAVEGTVVTWLLKLNKPAASAKLISESGGEIALAPAQPASAGVAVTASITLEKSARYKLALIDEAGRKNKHDAELVVNVLPNRPPDLKLVFPRRDLRVSPIEEALVVAEAMDDFGLKAVGISYSMAGGEPVEKTLAKDVAGKTKQQVEELLAFEAMSAKPDQLLSYHFWADDVGPDGKVRRTFGDMFFAEVRPFEEIFREGQAPSASEQQQQQQQQQGQQQQIGEAIKSQREIITATWNLIRRETQPQPTSKFKDDAAAVRDAQQEQLEKIKAVKEELRDPQSLAHVEAVEKHMTNAASHLAEAAEANAPAELKKALPEEQAAYQALLKLQAREHEVIKAQRQRQQQRGQQSGQQQAGPSQQQLNELELNNQDNRYEQQSTAQEQQEDPAKRETRQAMNRLRDLARRQQDLNEKLKEMELAMQEAKSQQEKEELQKQLKRLREQQEEMLRDVDELKNRMEQSQQAQQQNQQNQQQQSQQSQQANSQSQQNRNQQNQQNQNQQNQNQQNQNQQANAEEKRTEEQRRRQEEANDARQQVEEARQNIRESAEALEQGLTSKALAEGTRAERKLTELKEEFRKRAAGEFAEDMQQMRRGARELADKQEDLSKKIDQLDQKGQPRSLRDTGERKQVADELGKQKEKLEGLTEQMKKVTDEAELSEPLLSKQLYETLRTAAQQKVDQALDVARQLLDQGFNDEAKKVEPQARRGIDEIKKGVEKAAESVLGDEAESLRRARQALDDLAKEAERERGEPDPRAGPSAARGDDQKADESKQLARGDEKGKEPREQRGDQKGDQPGQQRGDQKGDQPGQQRGDQEGDQPGQQRGDQKGDQPGQQRGDQKGDQPGQQRGDQKGDQPGQQRGDQKGDQPGQQRGDQKGDQPGEQRGDQKGNPSSQPGGAQPGQPGDQPSPTRSADASAPNDAKSGEQRGGPSRSSAPNQRPQRNPSFLDELSRSGTGGGNSGAHGPITGEDFREWSDRLRDVEEMIDDPKLREEVARVRDRAKAMRAEFKRHGKTPQWDDVKKLIAQPLVELRDKLDDELARRDSKRELVPIDRDPVPGQFSDLVKKYYEKLGTGD